MRTSRISALIPLTTALILTCCSSDRGQGHSFEVEEIDGVLTAVNRGGPKFSEELFVYEKVVELEQDESQPESLLNRPETFLFDEQGYYYVEDDGNTRIAVFDPTGVGATILSAQYNDLNLRPSP